MSLAALQAGVDSQTRFDEVDYEQRKTANERTHVIYPGAKFNTDPNVQRVYENDLCFRGSTGINNRGSRLDNGIPVSSNLNGYCVLRAKCKNETIRQYAGEPGDPQPTEAEILCELRRDIRLIGSALQTTNPKGGMVATKHCTALVHGLHSIFHTGDNELQVGDILVWDLFTKKEIASQSYRSRMTRFGRHPDHVPLKTTTVAHVMNDFYQSIHDQYYNSANPVKVEDVRQTTPQDRFIKSLISIGGVGANLQANPNVHTVVPATELKSALDAVAEMTTDLRRREIGKVMSPARPGEMVDVLIGSS